MEKITGMERVQDVPTKVLLMYEAVEQLIVEGVDINDIRVSTITDRAGIGKGTAYDYFDTKDEILACAVIYYIRKVTEEIECMLSAQNCFKKQVNILLDEMEKGGINRQCLIRYIHVMTDQSNFSRLVQEKICMQELESSLPVGVFTAMIKMGIEQGEIRKDIPINYMVYSLLSRLISYMLYISRNEPLGMNAAQIRPLVYQSILDELCEKNG